MLGAGAPADGPLESGVDSLVEALVAYEGKPLASEVERDQNAARSLHERAMGALALNMPESEAAALWARSRADPTYGRSTRPATIASGGQSRSMPTVAPPS